MKHGHVQPTYTDSVCGMELSLKTAIEETEYKGNTDHLCAKVCREAVEASPEQYVHKHPQAKEKTP